MRYKRRPLAGHRSGRGKCGRLTKPAERVECFELALRTLLPSQWGERQWQRPIDRGSGPNRPQCGPLCGKPVGSQKNPRTIGLDRSAEQAAVCPTTPAAVQECQSVDTVCQGAIPHWSAPPKPANRLQAKALALPQGHRCSACGHARLTIPGMRNGSPLTIGHR